MTIIQKRVRLFGVVIALMLATVPYGWAQERPECANGPGVCFLNADDLAGQFDFGLADSDGDILVLAVEFTSADDWVRFNPDGSTLSIHFTDAEGGLVIFPSTGGALSGSGRATANVAFPDFCPLTLSLHGVVTDGQALFDVSAIIVSRPNRDTGCTFAVNDVKISLQN
jgi:hypothetical protein